MMADIARIKAAINLPALMGQSRPGQNVRCPFHEDRTPSCAVDSERFHCFGCQAQGDAVDYFGYTQYGSGYNPKDSAHFRAAMEAAAAHAGIALGDRQREAVEGQRRPAKRKQDPIAEIVKRSDEVRERTAPRVSTALTLAHRQADYEAALSPRALDYWRSRGFDLDLARHYGMGERKGWKGADRVTFPFTLPTGEIRRHYGRAIGNPPEGSSKAMYTSKAELGLPSDEGLAGWFNAPAILADGPLYICEGVPDALALIQTGHLNTVALGCLSLGSAFDFHWLPARQGVRHVFLCLDCDPNGRGQEASQKIKAEIEAKTMGLVRVQICRPPDGCKDFAEALEKGIPISLPDGQSSPAGHLFEAPPKPDPLIGPRHYQTPAPINAEADNMSGLSPDLAAELQELGDPFSLSWDRETVTAERIKRAGRILRAESPSSPMLPWLASFLKLMSSPDPWGQAMNSGAWKEAAKILDGMRAGSRTRAA